MCVCGFGFRLHSAFFWLGYWSVLPLACAASASRHRLVGLPVAWGCAGVAVGGVCPPPSPFAFFFGLRGGGGFRPCRVVALGCPPLPVPVLGLLVSVPLSSFVRAARMSFFFFFCPPLLQWGVCRRVLDVLCSGGLLLSAACRRLWQGGPPVFFRGAPSVSPLMLLGWGDCPPLVEWVRGFVAGCLSLAPPPLFLLFVCFLFSSGGGLPVPPSAFSGLVHALVVIRCS